MKKYQLYFRLQGRKTLIKWGNPMWFGTMEEAYEAINFEGLNYCINVAYGIPIEEYIFKKCRNQRDDNTVQGTYHYPEVIKKAKEWERKRIFSKEQ